jgi:hypothetical protein
MSAFPNLLFGPEQEPFNTYADRRYPLGTKLITADGRVFRFGLAGGTALAAGKLVQAAAPIAAHVLQTPQAAAVGATSVVLQLGASAVSADQYRDGVVAAELGSGKGYVYPIDAHAPVLSGGIFTIPLKRGIQVQVAIDTTANSLSLVAHPLSKVILCPTTLTAQPVGVPIVPLAIGAYGWFQVHGLASVLTNGTVVAGNLVVNSQGTAGAVEAMSATIATTVIEVPIGRVAHVATSTNYSTIDLNIE